MIDILVFVCVIALVLINVPIAVALGIAAVLAMLATQGSASLPNLAIAMYNGATSFPLIAIPLFILAGAIMNTSGISRRLIDFATALFGSIRGALAQVNVVTSMFFAEISGSAVADVAATGPILIPAMKKRGYPGPFAAAVTSSSASLAIIIPPSIPMILYAVMAGTSVVQMFVAGIVPGLLAGLSMMALCYYYAVRFNWPVEEAFQLRRLWTAFKNAGWALTMPLIILGGIFGGVVTATEGAALAVVAALFIGIVIYRELDWRHLRSAIIDGGVQTGVVMLLVASSALLGLYLTEAQVPQRIAAALLAITDNQWAVLALLNVFLLVVGMFLHSAAAIILVVPIVMPLVNAVGIDPVHFGIVVTLNLAIGQQTPPVASVLMITCSIAKESVWDVTRANIPFILVLLTTLLLVTYVPATTLTLVDIFYR
ncbi:MAG: TRAP transporter large permease [Burkholderiaceae bacterium]|nr:TRAP transporter large permease [Burkholderiaceae bacterium]